MGLNNQNEHKELLLNRNMVVANIYKVINARI